MPRISGIRLIALAAALLVTACRPAARPEVVIAAAANLTAVFERIGPEFERQTGIHPVFTFGSTAQLAQQIENSAPFDLFAAADSEHIASLNHKGLLEPGSRAAYAVGVLALWMPPRAAAKVSRLEDLTSPAVRVIAIAKPELAPYGQAAVETLQRIGLWDRVQPKVVYAENISMAREFGASGNADAVFTARSLVLKEPGRVLPVDDRLHSPISQELGIVRASRHIDAARKFAAFLTSGAGRAALESYGYRIPR